MIQAILTGITYLQTDHTEIVKLVLQEEYNTK